MFEKWFVVLLIELLPPLIPPIYWGETIKKSGSLPNISGRVRVG
jgi:hypothetical protein